MGVRDEIFPTNRSERFVQTEWAAGWGYAVIGFGEAARMLTEERHRMHASVDQIGLAVFYLQRHRVELVLKQALIDLGEEAPAAIARGHDLAALWHLFEVRVSTRDPAAWDTLNREHGEFVAAMHEADKSSFSYRYPVDQSGGDVQRASFIDLDALQRHAVHFEDGVHGYLDWLSESRGVEPDFSDEF